MALGGHASLIVVVVRCPQGGCIEEVSPWRNFTGLEQGTWDLWHSPQGGGGPGTRLEGGDSGEIVSVGHDGIASQILD